MTKDEFATLVDSLTQLRHWLYSNSAQQTVSSEPQAVRDQFVSLRREVNFLTTQLQNAELESISDKLDQLGPELTAGINSINASIASVAKITSILNTVSDVVGLLARVVALV
jgi:hypothetical protein